MADAQHAEPHGEHDIWEHMTPEMQTELKTEDSTAWRQVVGVLLLCGWLPHVPSPGLGNFTAHGGFAPKGLAGIGAALLVVVFAFGGTEIVAVAAAETQDPERSIARAIRTVAWRIAVFYLGSLAVIVAVVPWTSAALKSPFAAVLQVNSRGKYFYEWGPPTFTRFYAVVLLVLLALTVVPRLRRGRVPWFDIALIGLAGLWAVYSLRTVPVAACLAAPLAAAAIQPWLGARPDVRRLERGLVVGGYLLALAGLALVVPHTADQPREAPAWVDDALGDLPEGTKVVDDSAYGGYLMWRFPQLDLVMHGYGDTFTDDELERNADIDAVRGGWVALLRDTEAELILDYIPDVVPDASLPR